MCKTALLGPLPLREGSSPFSVVLLCCWAPLFWSRKQRLEISLGAARTGPKERESAPLPWNIVIGSPHSWLLLSLLQKTNVSNRMLLLVDRKCHYIDGLNLILGYESSK